MDMNLPRVLESLSDLSVHGVIPNGITDEGRIFALGRFENADYLHGRVKEVVEGLKDHVGQPFETHPWVFTFDLSTIEQDGVAAPMTLVGVVWLRSDGSVFVRDFSSLPKELRPINQFMFEHTTTGTTVTVLGADGTKSDLEDPAAGSFYPLAIAILNTRGCSIELKRAPGVINARRKRQGKPPIPAHYDVDGSEHVSALRSTVEAADRGGTHASPIPHLAGC